VNTVGSYTCVDINECQENAHDCTDGYICANNKGSFTCQDVDECSTDVAQCAKGTECQNVVGTFRCIDIDECLTNPCAVGLTCQNEHLTYRCIDKNECLADDICTEGYECVNTHGSYKCTDINECVTSTPCAHKSLCENTEGSFVCKDPCESIICESGLTPTPVDAVCKCVDIDECTQDDSCPSGHSCINTHGSFTCRDVNECTETSCNSGYECINTVGSFKCALKKCTDNECDLICDEKHSACYCLAGYKQMKDKCVKINRCVRNNGGCEQLCTADGEDVTCTCKPGFELASNSMACNIIQPCKEEYNKCSHVCIPLPTDKIVMTPDTARVENSFFTNIWIFDRNFDFLLKF